MIALKQKRNKQKPLFKKGGKPDFSYRKCNTVEELAQYITELVNYKHHNYNTSGYAITKALLATDMLMAHLMGTTGFQHGYATNAFVAEVRGSKTGVAILNFDKLMYPQYDILNDVIEWINDIKKSEHFKKVVAEEITEDDKSAFKAHPNVRARWEQLLKGE